MNAQEKAHVLTEALPYIRRFFGKTVILSARIAAQARGGEILASALVRDLTEHSGDLRFEHGRDVELKGISGVQRIYTVIW